MTVALDLFAGTGWGVACQRLGIEEHGVELMPEAVATREAAGMSTIYRDVWEGLEDPFAMRDGWYDLLIASPPCQTFSMAGGGAGRRALDEVLGLIDSRAFTDPAKLREFGEKHDPRTALVLTPLAHVARDTPRLVVFEQVPTVKPVWEAAAEVMRSWGYSVVTDVLNAEQYGVPQTRKRAILVARWDAEARMPTPTHSRYYPRDPSRLDPGVLPWVSMADALGWGMTDKPIHTLTGGTHGAPDEFLSGGSSVREAVRAKIGGPDWRFPVSRPAPTVTGGGTATGGAEPFGRRGRAAIETAVARDWMHERPATTVAGDPRIAEPGWRGGRADYEAGRPIVNQHDNSTRVTVTEAAVLQSYPADFPFQGTNTKRFLQIGNAVPPRLAEAILKSLLT